MFTSVDSDTDVYRGLRERRLHLCHALCILDIFFACKCKHIYKFFFEGPYLQVLNLLVIYCLFFCSVGLGGRVPPTPVGSAAVVVFGLEMGVFFIY
jgi:hypothetical protein